MEKSLLNFKQQIELNKCKTTIIYLKKDINKDILFNFLMKEMHYQIDDVNKNIFSGLTFNEIFNADQKCNENIILKNFLDRYGNHQFDKLSFSKQILGVRMFNLESSKKLILLEPAKDLTLEDYSTLLKFINNTKCHIMILSNDFNLINQLSASFLVVDDHIHYYKNEQTLEKDKYTMVSMDRDVKHSFNYQDVVLHQLNQSKVIYFFDDFKAAQDFYDEARLILEDSVCYISSESTEDALRRIYEF